MGASRLKRGRMRFEQHFLDELKSRLRASDVIGRYVQLKKQGREYCGLSPFTSEKSPSFFVNDDKGMYFDFSSGRNGDIIKFLQEVERLSFFEAVKVLAEEAGLRLPEEDPGAVERAKRRAGLSDWVDEAQRFYAAALRGPEGREAAAYLEGKRGLPASQWERFDIGYAPKSRTALKDHLLGLGARPETLIEAGLLVAPEDGGAPFDRFRGRVMFLIRDGQGKPVGFGGRALDPGARAKYLNSPDGPLFHKGHLLYRAPEARKLAAKTGREGLIVAEGYLDVIALERAGFPAVAPLGTAITEEQLKLLWRAGPTATICLDGDRAGRAAAARAAERALPLLAAGRELRFAMLPDGLDPDDLIARQGAPAMRGVLERACGMIDILWDKETADVSLDRPEALAGAKARLRALAGAIPDPDVRSAYEAAFARRLEDRFGLTGGLNGSGSGSSSRAGPAQRARGGDDAPDFRGRRRQDRRGGRFDRAEAPAGPSAALQQLMAAQEAERRKERLDLWRGPDFDAEIETLIGFALLRPPLLARFDHRIDALATADPELAALKDALLDAWFAGTLLDSEGEVIHFDNQRLDARAESARSAARRTKEPVGAHESSAEEAGALFKTRLERLEEARALHAQRLDALGEVRSQGLTPESERRLLQARAAEFGRRAAED